MAAKRRRRRRRRRRRKRAHNLRAGPAPREKAPSNSLLKKAKKPCAASTAAATTGEFHVGDLVEVDRKWARDGGTAKVTAVKEGKYSVKYVAGGTERNLPEEALTLSPLGFS